MENQNNLNIEIKKTPEKDKNYKIVVKNFSIAIITTTIILGAFSIPYATSKIENEQYTSSHQISEETTESPWTYEKNTKAYLTSDTLFEGNDGVLPVGQYEDNDYGLEHDVEGNYTKVGSIFKDYRNNESIQDEFTLIYGHNIVGSYLYGNDLMFGKIADFADTTSQKASKTPEENYTTSPSIDYYDEYSHYRLDIFASGIYDASEIINWVGNFKDETDFQTKITKIINQSDIETSIIPDYKDKIVCLWTCPYTDSVEYENENNRVLVFTKAVELEKYNQKQKTKTL